MTLRKKEFAMLRSAGLSKKEFYIMMKLESVFLGLRTIFWGILISLIIHSIWTFLYYQITEVFIIDFPFKHYLIAIMAVILIITMMIYYSFSKIKNINIIEAIKNENL